MEEKSTKFMIYNKARTFRINYCILLILFTCPKSCFVKSSRVSHESVFYIKTFK